MSNRVTLVHPNLPSQPIQVLPVQVPAHLAVGWQRPAAPKQTDPQAEGVDQAPAVITTTSRRKEK